MQKWGVPAKGHPAEPFLIQDSFPSVFCPGCGIGTVMHALIEAVREAGLDAQKIHIISGVGCTGKIPDIFGFRSQSSGQEKILDLVGRLEKEPGGSKRVALLNNADFFISGAEDFFMAARRGEDVVVVHINNFICAVSENGFFPMTPFIRRSVDGKFELPFNMPHLARSYGARYIARWTPLRAGWLKYSFLDVFPLKGFSYIEVISPCLIFNVSTGRIQDPVDRFQFYDMISEIRQDEPMENLDLRRGDKIYIGIFLDKTHKK